MVFGGTEHERLQVNESTLWGGGPHDYTDPDASTRLEEIRRLIFAGKVAEAEKLSDDMMGRPKLLMPYQPFCDLRLHFPGHDQATAYSACFGSTMRRSRRPTRSVPPTFRARCSRPSRTRCSSSG